MVRYTKNFTCVTNVKTKKRSWSAREKLAILAYLENKPGASKRNTAEKFDIQPKQIRDWIYKHEELKRSRPQMKRLTPGARPRYPALEDDLVIWVRSLRREQKVVSRFMVRSKAKSLAERPRFLAIYPNIGDCKWSDKWLDGFMNRYHLSVRRRTTVSQKLPSELESTQHQFLSFVLYQRIQYNYPLALIGNMDETPLTFDVPNNTTIEETGASTVSIRTTGHEKSNFTVVLACMADG